VKALMKLCQDVIAARERHDFNEEFKIYQTKIRRAYQTKIRRAYPVEGEQEEEEGEEGEEGDGEQEPELEPEPEPEPEPGHLDVSQDVS
jgi:hypothetical protein